MKLLKYVTCLAVLVGLTTAYVLTTYASSAAQKPPELKDPNEKTVSQRLDALGIRVEDGTVAEPSIMKIIEDREYLFLTPSGDFAAMVDGERVLWGKARFEEIGDTEIVVIVQVAGGGEEIGLFAGDVFEVSIAPAESENGVVFQVKADVVVCGLIEPAAVSLWVDDFAQVSGLPDFPRRGKRMCACVLDAPGWPVAPACSHAGCQIGASCESSQYPGVTGVCMWIDCGGETIALVFALGAAVVARRTTRRRRL